MSKGKAKKEQEQAEEERRQAEEKIIKTMDPTAQKQEFYSYRKRVNELLQEVNTLNICIAENNEKHLTETYEFQLRLKEEEDERDYIRQKHKQLVQDSREKWRCKRNAWEVQKNAEEAKRTAVITQLEGKVLELQNKLEKIKIFKSKQEELKATMEQLQLKIARSGSVQKEELSNLEDVHFTIRGGHTKIKDQKIDAIKENEYLKVRKMLDDRDKSIFLENDILRSQKLLYKEEEAALALEREKIKEEIKEQNKILKDLETVNPSQDNYERSLKIVNLQDRIAQLKSVLDDQVKSFDGAIEAQGKKYTSKIKQLQKEAKSVQNSIKNKQKQVKDLRMYAQMVLDQRKPLEWYALQVLGDNPKDQCDRMGTLDTILRQLFVKINSGVPPKSWRQILKMEMMSQSILKDYSHERVSWDWPDQSKGPFQMKG